MRTIHALFSMGLFCIAQAQMSGLYTIGGANPDYADLHAAIADLQLLGMSGSATLEVQPGTYSGLHIIDNIAGLSATSRLTITASDPTLRDAHFSNDGQVFAISSDHVSMVGLDITSGGAAPYASDAVIWTDAEGVELIDCTITMQDCSPYVFIDGDDVSNILLDGLDLVGVAGVTGCLISTGIQMEGTGIEIRDCSITDTRYAIQISGSDDITIQDCRMRPSPTSSTDASLRLGININTSNRINIVRNQIVLRTSANAAGIHLHGLDASTGYRVVQNNMISILPEPGVVPPAASDPAVAIDIKVYEPFVGALQTPAQGTLAIRHNSMYIEADGARGILIAQAMSTESTITSNSLRMIGDDCIGLDYEQSQVAPWPVSDHNNVKITGANSSYGVYATKALIQANTSMEDHSISGLPYYFSKTDLHIMDMSANIDRAFIDPSVPKDYDKDPRQYWDPEYDIGADEFDNLGLKSAVEAEPPIVAAAETRAYPNPAQNALWLSPQPQGGVQVFDTMGRSVTILNASKAGLDIGSLPDGTFLLRWSSAAGDHSIPVVVQR